MKSHDLSSAHCPFVLEVRGLHAFLEDWLKGQIGVDKGLARLERALSAEFVLVDPNGSRKSKTDAMQSFARAYAEKPESYSLQISDIESRDLGSTQSLVTYRETHVGEDGRDRISTALLRRECGAIQWLFLQETLIGESR